MNDLLKADGAKNTMTSLEIAELTGKKHSDVLRDIRKMFKDLEMSKQRQRIFEFSQQSEVGEMIRYELDKELTITLVSGYNVKLRNAIIKRWEELESKKPLSKAEMLLHSATLLVENEKRLKELEISQEVEHKKVNRLENTINRTLNEENYFTVIGYAILNKIDTNSMHTASIGKKCVKLSNELGYELAKIPDKRYGMINGYHKSVLKIILGK